jgi:endogenous inhibitor of DNA gyrase (YacG/DUF329 family)
VAAETPDDTSAAAPHISRPCPICGKPSSPAVRPFCSKRCADIDLHRWLGGVYAVPASDALEEPVNDRDDDA